MCAVAGIFAYHYAAAPVDRRALDALSERMASRGPDGAGTWCEPAAQVGLAHRRLAVIDPDPRSDQPMLTRERDLALSFNGEIYNYRELRGDLRRAGHRFETASDTEVVLALYREHPSDWLQRLRGMFALALWDDRRRTLVLARDANGIKPLYYSDDGWTVRVASQVKALAGTPGVSAEPDPTGIAGFCLLGSVPEPFTTLRAVRAVPAGSSVEVDARGPAAPRQWFDLCALHREARDTSPAPDDAERWRAAVVESVRAHCVADVPIGVFLSGGVDSGAILGVARDVGLVAPTTLTLRFEGLEGTASDEGPLARQVAASYGARHVERWVTRAEFESDLPRILAAMDQPTIDGVNTWFVAKAAAEEGLKVALCGIGGDELLGGYPSFRQVPAMARLLRPVAVVPGLGRVGRTLVDPLLAALGLSPKWGAAIEIGGSIPGAYLVRRGLFMPWELDRVLPAGLAAEGLRRWRHHDPVQAALPFDPGSRFAQVATLESALYLRNQLLRDADWASMAHSVEVRTPLVDPVLQRASAALCARLRPGAGKALLASAPSRPLPASVVERPKSGFTVPIAAWEDAAEPLLPATTRAAPASAGDRAHWSRRWAWSVARASGLVGVA